MPLLSDYLNFNGVPGTQGPQGAEGPQGDPAASISIKGIDTWANIDAIAAPELNDAWVMNEVTGAPLRWEGAPAELGDAVVYSDLGTWINIGPIMGPQGFQGVQGETGKGVTPKGTDIWANISLITDMDENDLWILTAGDPGAPQIGVSPGPGRAAEAGDGLVWNTIEWINIGPIRGPEGAQGFQGFQGEVGGQGPQGFQGFQGDIGFQGVEGDPAQSIIIKGNDTWANISALPSPVQNEAWFLTEATGAPASAYGPAAIGDVVIYDGVSTWTNAGPLVGPQGDDGAQGVDGADGVQGADGADGVQGAQGDTGVQGAVGQTGPQGSQGVIGSTGTAGPAGPQGFQGVPGEDSSQTTVGLWTPTVIGAHPNGSPGSSMYGSWVRIDDRVTVTGFFHWNTFTPEFDDENDNVTFGGLPFTVRMNVDFDPVFNPRTLYTGTIKPQHDMLCNKNSLGSAFNEASLWFKEGTRYFQHATYFGLNDSVLPGFGVVFSRWNSFFTHPAFSFHGTYETDDA